MSDNVTPLRKPAPVRVIEGETRAKIPNLAGPLADSMELNDTFEGLVTQDWDGDGDWRYTVDVAADIQHNNTRRAGFAMHAVHAFLQRVRGDDEAAIRDLLCDLMHLCDALGLDFDSEVEAGRVNYDTEVQGE